LAIRKLKTEEPNHDVYFVKLDLGDIISVAEAAREIIAKETRLDLLFNNAYFI
jgi:NAD(P)-dependent dehydrogenase (short-subunit alcohol dehydrogenase family)